MMVAKQAAAAANHTDEYPGYATLLTSNTSAVVNLMASAYGNNAANQLQATLALQDGYLVDYTIGLITHNQSKSNGAMSSLISGFEPKFVQLISSLTLLPPGSIQPLEAQQITQLKAVIDDEASRSYTKLYSDLRPAYATSAKIGDAIAPIIVQQFPDKFPGGAVGRAVDERVLLNTLLQEHSYLAAMATDAAAAHRGPEEPAAASALASNASDLGILFSDLLGTAAGAQFVQLWGARDNDLVGYALDGDATHRQGLTDQFLTRFYAVAPVASDTARLQVAAALRVVDDQRASAYKDVAPDDHAAASAMRPMADQIV